MKIPQNPFHLLVFFIFLSLNLQAQSIEKGLATPLLPLEEVDLLVLPPQDNEALLREELKNRQPGSPPKFALSFPFDITPSERGNWEDLPNGQSVWRLRVISPSAYSLNLGFGQFLLPEGSRLMLYSPDKKKVLGPFTPADNDSHQEFWTPILEGDEMVIELSLPKSKKENLRLHINTINHDFLGFSTFLSGSCNLDVICGAADNWGIVDAYRDIIQSVAVYSTGGSTFCTGFLVNNTREDCTPFFMTADHCGLRSNNAASLVVYWNFQNSICRSPNSQSSGGPGDGQLIDFNSGAFLRARSSESDFGLLELDDPVMESANAFFAGWDASDNLPGDTLIAIHHPNTDEKRISFSFSQTFKGNQNGQAVANGNYLVLPQWDIGTTEGGSSGCPFFNKNKRVVGQLFGGIASCNNSEFDAFGWLASSWEGGGTANSRLKDWLDPDDTGILTLDGRSQNACNFNLEANETNFQLCATNTLSFELSASENFADSVALTLSDLPEGITATFSQNPIPPGGQSLLTLTNIDQIAEGSYLFNVSGTDGSDTAETPIQLHFSSALPSAPLLGSPEDQANNQSLSPGFSWEAISNAQTYEWQLSLDPAFGQLEANISNLLLPQLASQNLEMETTYYWRVRGLNSCGEGEWSSVFSFTTSGVYCITSEATDVPVVITSASPNIVESKMDVQQSGTIASVIISMEIKHTYVSDLSANLITPAGTTISLFVNPGDNTSFQGCANDDLILSFSDAAGNDNDRLQDLCSNNVPTISGQFKPRQPLENIAGEEASGTWTLQVIDEFDEDGGEISNWSLEICSTFPESASLIPSVNAISICPEEDFSLELFVGSGFNGDNLALSTGALPQGANIVFEQNPVAQASRVMVSGSGFTEPGQFTLDFNISDGNITANALVMLEVKNLPAMAIPIQPADQASLVGIAPTLSWSINPSADTYKVIVSTSSDLSDPLININTTNTSINIGELLKGQVYYWQITATNECGITSGNIWSFTTIPDVSFVANPNALTACPNEEPGFSILVDPDFTGPVSLTYLITPVSNLILESDLDLNALTPGQEANILVANLTNELAGNYDIQLSLSDGTLSATTNLNLDLLALPQPPTLSSPEDGFASASLPDVFNWGEVEGANSYLIEIATNASFDTIIESAEVTAPSFAPLLINQGGTYFWRVNTINDCGQAQSEPFQFTYAPNAIDEVEGAKLSIFPNPTKEELSVQLSTPISSSLQLELHSINGKKLRQELLPGGQAYYLFSLNDLPAGIYILSIYSFDEKIIKRIVKQ